MLCSYRCLTNLMRAHDDVHFLITPPHSSAMTILNLIKLMPFFLFHLVYYIKYTIMYHSLAKDFFGYGLQQFLVYLNLTLWGPHRDQEVVAEYLISQLSQTLSWIPYELKVKASNLLCSKRVFLCKII